MTTPSHQSDLEALFGISAEQMKTNLCATQLAILSAVAIHPGITKYGVREKIGTDYNRDRADALASRGLVILVNADPAFIPTKGRKQSVGMRVTQDGLDMLRAILREGARRGRGEA